MEINKNHFITLGVSFLVMLAFFVVIFMLMLPKQSSVTKANVIKTTDGKFLRIANEVAKDYPEIQLDDWYIDIMTAKQIGRAHV